MPKQIHLAGFALGAGTALLGEKAAMACTVAVEETIEIGIRHQGIGLEGEVERLAIEGYRVFFISPFFMGWRSFYHGALIGKSHTAPIRSAAIARLLVLLTTLGGLVVYGQLNGLMIAIWSMLASTVAEVVYLGWHVRQLRW